MKLPPGTRVEIHLSPKQVEDALMAAYADGQVPVGVHFKVEHFPPSGDPRERSGTFFEGAVIEVTSPPEAPTEPVSSQQPRRFRP